MTIYILFSLAAVALYWVLSMRMARADYGTGLAAPALPGFLTTLLARLRGLVTRRRAEAPSAAEEDDLEVSLDMLHRIAREAAQETPAAHRARPAPGSLSRITDFDAEQELLLFVHEPGTPMPDLDLVEDGEGGQILLANGQTVACIDRAVGRITLDQIVLCERGALPGLPV